MKQKKISEYPIIYLYIYHKLKEKANGETVLATAEVLEVVRRFLHQVPNNYRKAALAEMEGFTLIKRMNHMYYELTGGNVDRQLQNLNNIFWD